jgi:hypothetical protein
MGADGADVDGAAEDPHRMLLDHEDRQSPLEGLLPAGVSSLEQQALRSYEHYRAQAESACLERGRRRLGRREPSEARDNRALAALHAGGGRCQRRSLHRHHRDRLAHLRATHASSVVWRNFGHRRGSAGLACCATETSIPGNLRALKHRRDVPRGTVRPCPALQPLRRGSRDRPGRRGAPRG